MVNNIINFVESLAKNPLIELKSENLEFVNFRLDEQFHLRTGQKIKDQFGADLSKN